MIRWNEETEAVSKPFKKKRFLPYTASDETKFPGVLGLGGGAQGEVVSPPRGARREFCSCSLGEQTVV